MIAPRGVYKRPKPACPHKAAVYKTWRMITNDFKINYGAEQLQYYIDKSPFLCNLDKTELKKSYKIAYVKFRRENQPNRRNQIIKEMLESGELI